MTDGGTKTGSESPGGKGATGFVAVASGCAGIGVADGVASIMCLPQRSGPRMGRPAPPHGEGGASSRMGISASIARRSTSTIAASAVELDWTVARLSRQRSASTARHRVADQPNALAPPARSASSAASNASPVLSRWAVVSRRENGSSTAPEAARAKPGVSAPCHRGVCAGRQHPSARIPLGAHDLAAGARGADQGWKATRVRLAAQPWG